MISRARAFAALLAFALTDCSCGGKHDQSGSDAGPMDGEATDGSLTSFDGFAPLGRDIPRPTIHILTPAKGTLTKQMTISVTGTISADATKVIVKGVEAQISSGQFHADNIVLRDGDNLILAEATNAVGGTAIDSINVMGDVSPPLVSIRMPVEGDSIVGTRVTVIGTVRDPGGLISGLMISVNGVAAEIRGSDFTARDVPLGTGNVSLVATATDAAGNTRKATVHVSTRAPRGPTVSVLSGSDQTGTVSTELANPLVALLADATTQRPTADRRVTFEVLRGDGLFTDGIHTARTITVKTDVSGRASARFKLGRRTTAAGNVVRASAPGFDGQATFFASGVASDAVEIVPEIGAMQRGTPNERLPRPFVAKVVDLQGNGVQGVEVKFRVAEGGGVFDGTGSHTSTRTDADGRAIIRTFRLGPDEGLANNLVDVTFDGNTGAHVQFTATAVFPGLASETRVTGEVFDMQQTPLSGVKIRILGGPNDPLMTATTDDQGGFALKGTPTGLLTLAIDPSDLQDGTYAKLNYELVAIAGRNNRLPRPIYLPKLDTQNAVMISETQGGVLHVPGMPGVKIRIAPGSATFPDGTKSGMLSLTAVNHTRVPLAPPSDANSALDMTLQPANTKFDPPVEVQFPNIEGFAPGTLVNLMTFDHDLLAFVAVGTMQVTEDGTLIKTEPGQGLPKAGWHVPQTDPQTGGGQGFCPANPTPPTDPAHDPDYAGLPALMNTPDPAAPTAAGVASHSGGLDPASVGQGLVDVANQNCSRAFAVAGKVLDPANHAADNPIADGFTWVLDKLGCGAPKKVQDHIKRLKKLKDDCNAVGCCDPNCTAFVYDAVGCDDDLSRGAQRAVCEQLARCATTGFCDVRFCGIPLNVPNAPPGIFGSR